MGGRGKERLKGCGWRERDGDFSKDGGGGIQAREQVISTYRTEEVRRKREEPIGADKHSDKLRTSYILYCHFALQRLEREKAAESAGMPLRMRQPEKGKAAGSRGRGDVGTWGHGE